MCHINKKTSYQHSGGGVMIWSCFAASEYLAVIKLTDHELLCIPKYSTVKCETSVQQLNVGQIMSCNRIMIQSTAATLQKSVH